MQFLGQDYRFWIAVLATAAFKIVTSRNVSPTRVCLTVGAALLSAWAFTDALLDWFSLNPDTYQIPVAVLLGLTGEGAMRWLTSLTPDSLADFINRARGK